MRQRDWERFTIARLRSIRDTEYAYENVLKNINRLRNEASNLKVRDSTPVSGGNMNKEEERRLNNISLCKEMETNAKRLANEIKVFNLAWEKLNENEQTVLTYFYVNRPRDYIGILMERLNYEKSKVYYLKDEALYRLTKLLYGVE